MKKILPLIAAMLVQLSIGSLYAWNKISSAFIAIEEYHLNAQLMGVVFGIAVLSFTGIMIPLGKNLHRFSPKVVILTTALLYAAGFTLSGFSQGSYPIILIGNGLLVGLSIGIGYVSSMTYGIQAIKRKPLATGLITASFATGSIISAKAVKFLTGQGFPIGKTLIIMGVVQAIIIISTIPLFSSVKINSAQESETTKIKLPTKELLPLAFAMFAGTFGGLIIISNMKQIVGTLNTAIDTTWAISLFSIGNALGRFSLGTVKIKKYILAIAICMLIFVGLFLYMSQCRDIVSLYLSTLFTGALFGSFFVLFPMVVINSYGEKLFANIYPFIFLAYGIASMVSAVTGGYIYDIFKDTPELSLYIAAAIEFSGAILLIVHRKRLLKKRYKEINKA